MNVRVYERIAGTGDSYAEFLARTYGPPHPVPIEAEGRELISFLPMEEGASTLLKNFAGIHASLLRLVALPSLATIARGSVLVLALTVAGLAIALRRRRMGVSGRFVAAFATLAAIDLEYFLPIRHSYADILFLLPLALLVPALFHCDRLKVARTLVLAGLILGQHRSILSALTGCFEYSLIASGLTIALLQLAIGRAAIRN